MSSQNLTVFSEEKCFASGDLATVIDALLPLSKISTYLIFNDHTGKAIEIDLRGTTQEIYARTLKTYPNLKDHVISSAPDIEIKDETAPRGRGRPKLGVVAKEITLLPRHWEWLAEQSSGASAAIRRLVDEARKQHTRRDAAKKAHERTYQFMMAVAGNLPLYEEALRALFANDTKALATCIAGWPSDTRNYIEKLSSH